MVSLLKSLKRLSPVLMITLSITTDLAAQQPGPAAVAGTWGGVLMAGSRLSIVFHITAAADGKLTATMDSPDQGVAGIPFSAVTFSAGTLKLVSTTVQGEFEGTLSADGTTISGEWRQSGGRFPLEMKRGAPPERKRRPQEPVPPLPYEAEEVSFPNAAAGIALAGTLTRPRTAGPYPAVVLITGSGPQDRDESLLGHKPFLVLADHLTRRGIAVLRYDDRGVARSGGTFATATSPDFMSDALAAVAYLKTRPEIDAARIGLIGHSEGGLIAPMAAVQSRDVAFIVMMAGPGVTGEEILYEQGAKIARAAGATEAAVQKGVAAQRQIFSVIKQEDGAQLVERVRAVMHAQLDSLSAEERAAMGAGGDVNTIIEAQVKQVTAPWFRWFLTYDPRTSLEHVTVPVLAINGELDLQVPPEQSLPVIEAALKQAANKDFTVRRLPRLNHLFQTATTGAPSEYDKIEETLSPAALDLMSGWILARFGKPVPRS